MKPCPLCGAREEESLKSESHGCSRCDFYCDKAHWEALPRALGPPERFVPTSFAGEFELDDKEE